jgi:CubicO group peptidase (beta-lactamase class C family)
VLPSPASLRYLKLEAKRRLAAGEFPALHLAQLAVAREHGQPSWAALKQLIASRDRPDGHALAHVRWIVSRFRDADVPGWTAPGEAELAEHFSTAFLRAVTPDRLVATFTNVTPELREELVVSIDSPLFAQARISGYQVGAVAAAEPPHRLSELTVRRAGSRVTDPRVASPPTNRTGDVPAAVHSIAAKAIADLGLASLALAGGVSGALGGPARAWSAATGWAHLEQNEALSPAHMFPAYDVTKVVTAVLVLCLAADGRVGLDDPANRHLRAVRLADDGVTIRELLTHTGGVRNLDTLFGPRVAELVSLAGGRELACTGDRGTFEYSNAGFAAAGQLAADVTGLSYPDAVTRLVLGPLGMSGSAFPPGWPADGAVTCYDVAADGSFEPLPASVCVLAAAGGLWTTAADLVRFGLGWASLLPRSLAAEALRPQADRQNGTHSGLGWIVNEALEIAGHAGEGLCAGASLLVSLTDGRAHAALSSRPLLVEPVNGEVLRAVRAAAA